MLYYIQSKALKQYGNGTIIIEADTLEQAKEKALLCGRLHFFNERTTNYYSCPLLLEKCKVKTKEQLITALKTRPKDWWYLGYEDYLKFVVELKQDITTISVVESGAVFINGSE